MRMQGFGALTQATGGSFPNAFKAAYVGPPSSGSMVIGNPAGAGGVMTTNFNEDGPIASYDELRDGVRYGWPLMFALGWAGSYVFWRWRWKKTGRLSGLNGTPEEHLARFREYSLGAEQAIRNGKLKTASAYIERAWAESLWTPVPKAETKHLVEMQGMTGSVVG